MAFYPNLLPFSLGCPAGSKVYVVDDDSSEPATVYSDKYGTIASQPLTADQYGRVNCYADEGAYDVIVRDEDGVELFSAERIITTEAFVDAPNDGVEYVRKDCEWVETEKGLLKSGNSLTFG